MTEPLRTIELLLLLRALHARASLGEPAVTIGDVTVDPVAHRVRRGGEEAPLTAIEFRLLHALVRHRGRLLTIGQLLTHTYADERYRDPRLVARSNVRLKVGPVAAGLIRTVRGVGYRLEFD